MRQRQLHSLLDLLDLVLQPADIRVRLQGRLLYLRRVACKALRAKECTTVHARAPS